MSNPDHESATWMFLLRPWLATYGSWNNGKVHVVVILKVNSKVRKPLPPVIGVAAEIETCLSYWLLIGLDWETQSLFPPKVLAKDFISYLTIQDKYR